MSQNAIYTPIIGTGHDDPKALRRISLENAYTWATKPSASSFGLGEAYFSDINAIGWSDGTSWKLISPYTSTYNTILILPSLQTANGATYSQTLTTITVTSTGHNMTALVNGGQCYLVIGSGLATTGWYTNFTYVDANTFTVTSDVSQSTTGTVNTNTSEITITQLTTSVGGLMNENSILECVIMQMNNNSAGTKTTKVKLGSSIWSNFAVTTQISLFMQKRIVNLNNYAKQMCYPAGNIGVGGSTSATLAFTENTATALNHTVTLQLNSASDFVAVYSHQLRLL